MKGYIQKNQIKQRKSVYCSLIHSMPWDDSAWLQRQACTAPFHAWEKLSPSIRCPTRPVRFPLPLFAAVRPLGVVFCWLSLQARVWLCLTVQELRLCRRERALVSDRPAAESTLAGPHKHITRAISVGATLSDGTLVRLKVKLTWPGKNCFQLAMARLLFFKGFHNFKTKTFPLCDRSARKKLKSLRLSAAWADTIPISLHVSIFFNLTCKFIACYEHLKCYSQIKIDCYKEKKKKRTFIDPRVGTFLDCWFQNDTF